MVWLVPRQVRNRRAGESAPAPSPATAPVRPSGSSPVTADAVGFDALLDGLRAIVVPVPCNGCGGAHEMNCAEIVARQMICAASGGWPPEECDDSAQLAAILSPEDVFAVGGDPAAVFALLARRGALRGASPGRAEMEPAVAGAGRRDPRRILPAH